MLENESIIAKDKLLEFSIKQAIKVCLDKNILNKFLNDNASEVINMITTEFNLDDAKLIWQEEAFEKGLKQGMIKQINTLKKLNISNDEIIKLVSLDYNVSKDEIKKYL